MIKNSNWNQCNLFQLDRPTTDDHILSIQMHACMSLIKLPKLERGWISVLVPGTRCCSYNYLRAVHQRERWRVLLARAHIESPCRHTAQLVPNKPILRDDCSPLRKEDQIGG